MPSRGGTAQQLTTHPGRDAAPNWSPDGKEIVFDSIRGGAQGVWVVPAQGSEAQHVMSPGQRPSWSLDGLLAFYSGDDVYRILVRVEDAGQFEKRWEGEGRDVIWLRDATHILLCRTTEAGRDFWAVSFDGGFERALTNLEGKRGATNYRALLTDGEYLYFTWRIYGYAPNVPQERVGVASRGTT